MDFDGNLKRIKDSIQKAREKKARYRIGPELEVTGYGCEDHFLELDTITHSWECIADLIKGGYSDDILLDIGAPVIHLSVAYNCRVLILNREILLVRPKFTFADDGNYREPRWFTPWNTTWSLERLCLPSFVRDVTANLQQFCPIGQAIIELADGVTIGCESCEELWSPRSAHVDLYLQGVDIIGNASASHHSLRKLESRLELLQSATRKCGGLYLYSNQIGCDGGRLYYDGSALIAFNGSILCQGSQFTLATEVELITAAVEIQDIIRFRRGKSSWAAQAADRKIGHMLEIIRPKKAFSLSSPDRQYIDIVISTPIKVVKKISPEEEIARGPACWLWDYLRRSGMNGFFLPLSGGADSASTAAIVGSMCQMIVASVKNGACEERLLEEVRKVTQTDVNYIPTDSRELAGRILHTIYMGSSGSSSESTKNLASTLAKEVGAWHTSLDIEGVIEAILKVFESVFGSSRRPRFKVNGGTNSENLARQNVQARVRMVLAYLFAQLIPWATGKKGSLLVLGSSNLDESLRGYLTKYDCSSADLNPIGGISKIDLRNFLLWAGQKDGLGYSVLSKVVEAPPTAELEPLTDNYTQTDEVDMGMTYEELSWFGKLRKLERCGPYVMYIKLISAWRERFNADEIAKRVKFFFRMYSMNRHKLTTLTPSYHAEDYSAEDNRFDLRQFLYNINWTWQFRKIDEDLLTRREACQ